MNYLRWLWTWPRAGIRNDFRLLLPGSEKSLQAYATA